MSKKESFILYTEQKAVLDKLSDEQAGKLIKAIYEYEETGVMPQLDNILDLVITPFKLALDKNDDKWQETKQKRREAGKIGAEIKKQKQAKQANANFAKNDEANLASVNFDKQTEANEAVNVNVNDNVNVNVIKEKSERKTFTPPTLEEIEKYIQEKELSVDSKKFYDYFTEGNWIDSNGNQVKNWKQKLITWDNHTNKEKPPNKVESIEKTKFIDYDTSQLTDEEYDMLVKRKITVQELIEKGRINV